MPSSPPELRARELERLQRGFERQVEALVRDHEGRHPGPVELDVSLVPGEGSGPGDAELRRRVVELVWAFQRAPAVEASGVRVHRVTAVDADADGYAVVRVQYRYPA